MSAARRKGRDQAVALKYDQAEASAPKVVAKGSGAIAEKIRDRARKNGIPVYRDDTLVELLAQVDIDREIPQELYTAVAEVLAWIYRAHDALKQEMN